MSPALGELVMMCLEKRPADRWQSADELLDRLKAIATPSGGLEQTVLSPAESRSLAAEPLATRTEKAIAVLPFQNMSADPENEYFSDGITEELINALSQVTSLRVAARSSSFAFKGKSVNVHKVGEELNVTAVLEGSVRKAGSRLRITAQLINVADGYQIWSERYDRELEDVFAIQDEISQSIVDALRVVLSDEERNAIAKGQTANIEAYEFYLRGRQYFQHRQKTFQYARRMFSRATEIDPDYALAHAGIADCCSFLFMYFDASEANLAQADASSLKALELDPDLAEAHVSRGVALTVNKRYGEAEKEFETAIGLNPRLFEAHYF